MDKTTKQFAVCSLIGIIIILVSLFTFVLEFRCKFDNACNYQKIDAIVVAKGVYDKCDGYCRMMVYVMFDMPSGTICNYTCNNCDGVYNKYIINNKYDIYEYDNDCHIYKPFDTIQYFGIIIIMACISFMLILWLSYDYNFCKTNNNNEKVYLCNTKHKSYCLNN